MSDLLESSLNSAEPLPPNTLLRPASVTNTDGLTPEIRNTTNSYESDSESEKKILLELGVTPSATNTTTVPYTSEYFLDVQHLNNVYGVSTQHSVYQTDSTLLYNNPYNDGSSTSAHQLSVPPTQNLSSHHMNTTSSPSVVALSAVSYPSHVPQTVFTWSTSSPVTSAIPNHDINAKLASEIVPPPVCMTYPNTREHVVIKETNSCWKEKVLQSEKDYKKTACDRERTRMRDMNRAFDLLRSKLPISKPNGKKYSKIESLRIAINYINHLQQILKGSDDQTDQSFENYTKSNQNAVEYLTELSVRRRTNLYRNENNKKLSAYIEGHIKVENLDESHSTWSDSYMPNSQDKWE